MQFGRSFNLLRRHPHDHEFVIDAMPPSNAAAEICDGS